MVIFNFYVTGTQGGKLIKELRERQTEVGTLGMKGRDFSIWLLLFFALNCYINLFLINRYILVQVCHVEGNLASCIIITICMKASILYSFSQVRSKQEEHVYLDESNSLFLLLFFLSMCLLYCECSEFSFAKCLLALLLLEINDQKMGSSVQDVCTLFFTTPSLPSLLNCVISLFFIVFESSE